MDRDGCCASAYALRGLARARRGNDEGAREDCEIALKLEPDSIDALNCRANVHLEGRRTDLALKDLDRAEKLDPAYARTFLNRANLHLQAGRPADALRDGGAAARMQPDDFMAPYLTGRAYFAQGEYGKAVESFGAAITNNPGYAPAFLWRARARRQLKEYEAARADCDRALALGASEALAASVRYERAECDLALGEYGEAIRDAGEVLRVKPRHTSALHCRARAHFARKDYAKAESDLTQALAVNPGWTEAYRLRAEVREARDDGAGAAADRKKAQELDAR
jgi:tetratricopeptide (TPR) repeat protein